MRLQRALILIMTGLTGLFFTAESRTVRKKSIKKIVSTPGNYVSKFENEELPAIPDSLSVESDSVLFARLTKPDSLTSAAYTSTLKLTRPKVFSGYQTLMRPTFLGQYSLQWPKMQSPLDTLAYGEENDNVIPEWMEKAMRSSRISEDLEYYYMITNPASIEYAEWDLPKPPRLPDEDHSFQGFLKRQKLPKIDPNEAKIPEVEIEKRYWLHTFNTSLQLSQAYISSNWYQGGNDYLAILFNFNWNVDLNTVFKPNLLFQSSLQYKLGINSNLKGSLHRYSFTQDLLQYNLKTGLKALDHWFYSFTVQFTTQMFKAYEENSPKLMSSFLSPGTLNLGLGMTYSYQNPKKTGKISASISPLAYNLKTCINKNVDPEQFGIKPGHKTVSEIGSSAEINSEWNITPNISWKSRMFLFTDYHYFLAEWENTFNFQLNRFLSTQLYLYPRFDSSSELNGSKWKHWMFKEILSFGVSYTFSTKP